MEVRFPAFKLPSLPSEEEGVRFFETVSNKTGKVSVRIIDDLKIKKPTLGRRRLELTKRGTKLFRFKQACYSLGDLVKLNTGTAWWLDSSGKLFRLPKTETYQVVKRKIVATYQNVGYTLLVLEDEAQRFTSIYGPPSKDHLALLLTNGKIKLFYGYALPEDRSRYKKV